MSASRRTGAPVAAFAGLVAALQPVEVVLSRLRRLTGKLRRRPATKTEGSAFPSFPFHRCYTATVCLAGINVLPEFSTASLRTPEPYSAIMPRLGDPLANLANVWLGELAMRRKRAVTPQ